MKKIMDFARKNILLGMDPEVAHNLALYGLKKCYSMGLLEDRIYKKDKINVIGINFPNRVGLAAGFDKTGLYANSLHALGFGHVELGTITPGKQVGNKKPRIFRIPEKKALINRMGFNNPGVDNFVQNIKKNHPKGICGVSIGRSRDTTTEAAYLDYVHCFESVYPYADYIALNISSPNTEGLRDLEKRRNLDFLIRHILNKRISLEGIFRYKPVVLKISPDLNHKSLKDVVEVALSYAIDGIICGNTTVERPGVYPYRNSREKGGLSGAPLFKKSFKNVNKLWNLLKGKIPIIASGGITSGDDAVMMIKAGASLVQVFSGFVYYGESLIEEIIDDLIEYKEMKYYKGKR